MAFENRLTAPWTRKANSTGLKPKRFVTINTSAKAQYTAAGAAPVGVLVTGSTGSTYDDQSVGILSYGIARVEAAGGALKAGAMCQASSVGRATTMKSAGSGAGWVVDGTTGTTGRILSVLLLPFGVTT